MNKKVISSLLCAFTLLITSLPVYAEEAETESAEHIAEQLGGEAISPEEVPEGITPIEFDTVEEAKEFLEEVNEDLENATLTINDVDESRLRKRANSSTVTKTASWDTSGGLGVFKVNIYATCKVNNNKFTSVEGVTSSMTGVKIGSEWYQDTYSYSISNAGKKLDVRVYGHFDYFILINSKYTKVGSEKWEFPASWSY